MICLSKRRQNGPPKRKGDLQRCAKSFVLCAVQRKQNSTKLCDAGPLRSACIRPGTAACIGFGRTACDLHHSALSRPSLQHMNKKPLACEAGGSPAWIVKRYGKLLIVRAVAFLILRTEILCKIRTLATQNPTKHEEEKLFTAIAVATLPVVPRSMPNGGLVARREIFRTTMTRNCNFRLAGGRGREDHNLPPTPRDSPRSSFVRRRRFGSCSISCNQCCTLPPILRSRRKGFCTPENPQRLLNQIGHFKATKLSPAEKQAKCQM
jgi:hypothetical protein